MLAVRAAGQRLPTTEALLVSGGGARILPDPRTGLSVYGCRPQPDPDWVGLGSCTASSISPEAYAAADRLRRACQTHGHERSAYRIYRDEAERVRAELLEFCGFPPHDDVAAVLAASGTDLHLLAALWLKPDRIVMVAPEETGSGVPAALKGRYFSSQGFDGQATHPGVAIGDWTGELVSFSPRHHDGSLREPAEINADCARLVSQAANAGRRVLLVVTDTTKTGLIAPDVATALELQARWPDQVDVLVDACQFRSSMESVRAYVKRNWLVALTGSKFVGGPTFCGALLVPRATHRRYRDACLDAALGHYSSRADWPPGWTAAANLPERQNFGLLLRWEAALTELRAFVMLQNEPVAEFLQDFAKAVRQAFADAEYFQAVPVHDLTRRAPTGPEFWDAEQTIFPFLLLGLPDHRGNRHPVSRTQTESLYRTLLKPHRASGKRFQFGQPVVCGMNNGEQIGALRLCAGARMIVAACRDGRKAEVIADVIHGLDALEELLRESLR